MRNAKRAINSTAIFILLVADVVVAILAEVCVSAKAGVEGLRAAKHALPRDVVSAVDLTILITDTKRLKLASLAEEVIFRFSFHHIHLLLTIDQPAKVRLQTPAALVEGTPMQRVVELSVVVVVSHCRQSLFFVEAEPVRLMQGFLLDELSQFCQKIHLFLDWRAMRTINCLLATWTVHETKCDAQGAPPMLE